MLIAAVHGIANSSSTTPSFNALERAMSEKVLLQACTRLRELSDSCFTWSFRGPASQKPRVSPRVLPIVVAGSAATSPPDQHPPCSLALCSCFDDVPRPCLFTTRLSTILNIKISKLQTPNTLPTVCNDLFSTPHPESCDASLPSEKTADSRTPLPH